MTIYDDHVPRSMLEVAELEAVACTLCDLLLQRHPLQLSAVLFRITSEEGALGELDIEFHCYPTKAGANRPHETLIPYLVAALGQAGLFVQHAYEHPPDDFCDGCWLIVAGA
jgi:hypothetical protein